MKGKLPCSSLAEFHDILCVSGFTIVHWTTQTEVTEVCLLFSVECIVFLHSIAATCCFIPIVN